MSGDRYGIADQKKTHTYPRFSGNDDETGTFRSITNSAEPVYFLEYAL